MGFLQGFVVATDGFSPLATGDGFLSGPTNTSFSKWFECWMKDSSAWGKWGCVATHQSQRITQQSYATRTAPAAFSAPQPRLGHGKSVWLMCKVQLLFLSWHLNYPSSEVLYSTASLCCIRVWPKTALCPLIQRCRLGCDPDKGWDWWTQHRDLCGVPKAPLSCSSFPCGEKAKSPLCFKSSLIKLSEQAQHKACNMNFLLCHAIIASSNQLGLKHIVFPTIIKQEVLSAAR